MPERYLKGLLSDPFRDNYNHIYLKITEVCKVDPDENNEGCIGYRVYIYDSKCSKEDFAIQQYINNFDSNNILEWSSYDDFEGAALSSRLDKIEVIYTKI